MVRACLRRLMGWLDGRFEDDDEVEFEERVWPAAPLLPLPPPPLPLGVILATLDMLEDDGAECESPFGREATIIRASLRLCRRHMLRCTALRSVG